MFMARIQQYCEACLSEPCIIVFVHGLHICFVRRSSRKEQYPLLTILITEFQILQ